MKYVKRFTIIFLIFFSFTAYAEPNKNLTLANVDRVWLAANAALNLLKHTNPDIAINYIELNDDQLNVAVMAQQGDPDIMALEYEQYLTYARQGALVDLSHSDELMGNLSQWMPGISNLLSIDGKLYALPLLIMTQAFVLDGPMYRASSFDWPKDRDISWQELADLAQQAQLGANEGKPGLFSDFLSFPWPLWQYIGLEASKNEYISFETTSFRETMEAYKKLVLSGAVIDAEVDTGNVIANLQSWDLSGIEDVERRMIPTIGNERAVLALPYVIAINANSDQLELAMQFMDCLASREAQQNEGISLGRYFLNDTNCYRNDPTYSEEDFNFRDMLQDNWILRRSFPDLFVYCKTGIMSDYYNGRITIDDLIKRLQSKMDMIQME